MPQNFLIAVTFGNEKKNAANDKRGCRILWTHPDDGRGLIRSIATNFSYGRLLPRLTPFRAKLYYGGP